MQHGSNFLNHRYWVIHTTDKAYNSSLFAVDVEDNQLSTLGENISEFKFLHDIINFDGKNVVFHTLIPPEFSKCKLKCFNVLTNRLMLDEEQEVGIRGTFFNNHLVYLTRSNFEKEKPNFSLVLKNLDTNKEQTVKISTGEDRLLIEECRFMKITSSKLVGCFYQLIAISSFYGYLLLKFDISKQTFTERKYYYSDKAIPRIRLNGFGHRLFWTSRVTFFLFGNSQPRLQINHVCYLLMYKISGHYFLTGFQSQSMVAYDLTSISCLGRTSGFDEGWFDASYEDQTHGYFRFVYRSKPKENQAQKPLALTLKFN